MSPSHVSELVEGIAPDLLYHVKLEDNSKLVLQSEGSEKVFRDEDVIGVVTKKVATNEDRNEVPEQHSILLLFTKTDNLHTIEFTFESFQLSDVPRSILDKSGISLPSSHLFIPRGSGDVLNLHVVISFRSGRGEAQHFFDAVIRKAFKAVGLKEQAY